MKFSIIIHPPFAAVLSGLFSDMATVIESESGPVLAFHCDGIQLAGSGFLIAQWNTHPQKLHLPLQSVAAIWEGGQEDRFQPGFVREAQAM